MISLSNLNVPDVWHVCRHMRKSDWQEVTNLIPRHAANPDAIAMLVMSASQMGFVLKYHGRPVVVVQLVETHDGNWQAGLFATDEFSKVWRATIKEIRNVIFPALIDLSANCLSVYVQSNNTEAKSLLKFIGFNFRCNLPYWGTYGEPFDLYSIHKGQVDNVFCKNKSARCKAAG